MGHRSSLPLPAQPARHAPAATHNAPNQATPSTSIARPDEEHACRQRLLLPETHIRGQERRGEGADSTTLPHAQAPSPSAAHTAEEESESTPRRYGTVVQLYSCTRTVPDTVPVHTSTSIQLLLYSCTRSLLQLYAVPRMCIAAAAAPIQACRRQVRRGAEASCRRTKAT